MKNKLTFLFAFQKKIPIFALVLENNVEAFRYYLAFEIWTISFFQDNEKVAPALVFCYMHRPCQKEQGRIIYKHKAWDYCLYRWKKGSPEPQMQ